MKKSTKSDKLSVTIGIPTCYGGESLVETVKTIYKSKNIAKIRCIVIADRTPIKPAVRQQLEALGVELYWNSREGSQFKKLKQIINKVESDIFIFTQDDIIFNRATISEIVKVFIKNTQVTVVGSRVLPLKAGNLFEKSMTSMVNIVDKTAKYWKKGNNYLAASGRCIAFRTNHLKKFRIPEKVVNGDMYLYLENKRLGGEFTRADKAVVYIRCPQTLSDQIGPSSRFQFSAIELSKYFKFDIKPEYNISKVAVIKAAMNELFKQPVSVLLYFFVYLYTRLRKQSLTVVNNPIWAIDKSTKK